MKRKVTYATAVLAALLCGSALHIYGARLHSSILRDASDILVIAIGVGTALLLGPRLQTYYRNLTSRK